tara:strand:+ start:1919 stop:3745 length:1827 start_codon:yes stop_codon:yes gene_type:complete
MAAPRYNIPISATDKTAAAFKSVNQAAGRLAASAAKIGLAFATAGAAAAAALTKMQMSNIDSLAKTADKIGVTTEALGGLRHAAELTGVGSDTLDMAMQRLTRRVSEAANGTGEAKNALIELGINAANLEQLPLDVQMEVIADAMGDVKSQSDKVRLAMKLFDSEGVSLVNTLALGSTGLEQMAKEADTLGITVSRVDAAKIEMANDAVTKSKGVFTGLGNQLATAFSPIIESVSNNLYQAALDTEGFGNIGQDVADALVSGFGKFLDTVQMVEHGILSIKLAALKAQQAYEELLAPDQGRAEYFKQEMALQKQLNEGLINHGEFTKRQMALQKKLNDGTLTSNDAVVVGAEETQKAIDAIIAKIDGFKNTELPSQKITLLYERIKAEAQKAAEVIAEAAPGKVLVDDINKNGETALQRMTFFQEQQMAAKSKYDDFMAASDTKRTGIVIGELNNQFGAIASNNKKLFNLNKGFQIAQAVMQTYQGATLALSSYPPPVNFIMAAATIASGLGQVAQIKAQSFDGGGFTGNGSRSGGVDGKGGFPAILHPRETIVDHTKGQAGGITIVNNIDAKGADAGIEMKIRNAMQQSSQQTIASIQDLMRRGRFA